MKDTFPYIGSANKTKLRGRSKEKEKIQSSSRSPVSAILGNVIQSPGYGSPALHGVPGNSGTGR